MDQQRESSIHIQEMEKPKARFSLDDLITFGVLVICMASAAKLLPLWISKAGEIAIFVLLVSVAAYLAFPVERERNLDPH